MPDIRRIPLYCPNPSPAADPPPQGLMAPQVEAVIEPTAASVPTLWGVPVASQWTWSNVIEPIVKAVTNA